MTVRKISSIDPDTFYNEMDQLLDLSTHDAAKPAAKAALRQLDLELFIIEIRQDHPLATTFEITPEVAMMLGRAIHKAGFVYRETDPYEAAIREFLCRTTFGPWQYNSTEEYEARKPFSFFGFIKVHCAALAFLSEQELELLSLRHERISQREWGIKNNLTDIQVSRRINNLHSKIYGYNPDAISGISSAEYAAISNYRTKLEEYFKTIYQI